MALLGVCISFINYINILVIVFSLFGYSRADLNFNSFKIQETRGEAKTTENSDLNAPSWPCSFVHVGKGGTLRGHPRCMRPTGCFWSPRLCPPCSLFSYKPLVLSEIDRSVLSHTSKLLPKELSCYQTLPCKIKFNGGLFWDPPNHLIQTVTNIKVDVRKLWS